MQQFKEIDDVNLEPLDLNNIEIYDEYNSEELNNKITNFTFLNGSAGSGKSTSSFKYANNEYKNHEILVVTPQNLLALKIQKEDKLRAMTLHMLLGMGISEDKQKLSRIKDRRS